MSGVSATSRSVAAELFSVDGAQGQVWVRDQTLPAGGKWVDALTALNLPTSDPAIAGRVWNDGGVLKASAGS